MQTPSSILTATFARDTSARRTPTHAKAVSAEPRLLQTNTKHRTLDSPYAPTPADADALETSIDQPTLRPSAPWSPACPRAPRTVARVVPTHRLAWKSTARKNVITRRRHPARPPSIDDRRTREKRCRPWTNVCGRSRSSRTSRIGSTSMKSWRKSWSWERRPTAWKPSSITVRTDPSHCARIDGFDARVARTTRREDDATRAPGLDSCWLMRVGETDANISTYSSFGDSRLGQCSARDIERNHQTHVEGARKSGFYSA